MQQLTFSLEALGQAVNGCAASSEYHVAQQHCLQLRVAAHDRIACIPMHTSWRGEISY